MCFGGGDAGGGAGGAYGGPGSFAYGGAETGVGYSSGQTGAWGDTSGIGAGGPGFAYGGAETGTSFTGGPGSPGEMGGPGRGGFSEFIGKVAPVVGGLLGAFTGNPYGIALGVGTGKAVSAALMGESLGNALGKGALGTLSVAAPAIGIPGSFALGQVGKGQPSDLASPDALASLSGITGQPGGMTGGQYGGMAMPGQQPGPSMMGGPSPVTSVPAGPISASSLAVPPAKVNPLNLSNLLATRGIRGAGRVAPKQEWFERRT